MTRTEETRQVCDDIERIYELGKSLQLVILDCDMINNPIQLEKSGLMPITVFIKISDPMVLKRLIKTRGRNQIRHMGVQTMAAEKLCQCDPVSFIVIILFAINNETVRASSTLYSMKMSSTRRVSIWRIIWR